MRNKIISIFLPIDSKYHFFIVTKKRSTEELLKAKRKVSIG